ncbi:MAG TPA: hypothetical protein VKF40_04005 [Burkholderiales bacterium]|nr:hypothetical protein [Burkholderiales bacterium]
MKTLLAAVAALILVGALAGCADVTSKTDESVFQTLDHMRANPD